VSDGLRFDTNSEEYFHVPITPGKAESAAGSQGPEPAGRLEYAVDSAGRFAQVVYFPPEGFFEKGSTLMYMGGYNGWNGETNPVMLPMMPSEGGAYKANAFIPRGATVRHSTPPKPYAETKSLVACGRPLKPG
jgi:hypothetical protein